MKTFFVMISLVCLTACSTLGGAVSGAGKDLQKAGTWIESKQK